MTGELPPSQNLDPPQGEVIPMPVSSKRLAPLETADSYTDVAIMNKLDSRDYEGKWGKGVLDVLNVRVTRVYENAKKRDRVTHYPVRIGRRPDIDPSTLPVVSHSDALYTTMEVDGTATSRFFWNSVEAGFPTVNVGVKRPPNRFMRAIPTIIPLHEMVDDSLVATKKVIEDEELGVHPDKDGMIPLGASGYSRGFQLALMKAARAPLHGARVEHIQGQAPGPRNEASKLTVFGRVLWSLPFEAYAIGKQVATEPGHALKNYRGVLTRELTDIISYTGDANSLHDGAVSRSMPHLDRSISGHGFVMKRDPFGLQKEYGTDFNPDAQGVSPFANFNFIAHNGAHLSGMDRDIVKFDRDAWLAEAARRLGSLSDVHSATS